MTVQRTRGFIAEVLVIAAPGVIGIDVLLGCNGYNQSITQMLGGRVAGVVVGGARAEETQKKTKKRGRGGRHEIDEKDGDSKRTK